MDEKETKQTQTKKFVCNGQVSQRREVLHDYSLREAFHLPGLFQDLCLPTPIPLFLYCSKEQRQSRGKAI